MKPIAVLLIKIPVPTFSDYALRVTGPFELTNRICLSMAFPVPPGFGCPVAFRHPIGFDSSLGRAPDLFFTPPARRRWNVSGLDAGHRTRRDRSRIAPLRRSGRHPAQVSNMIVASKALPFRSVGATGQQPQAGGREEPACSQENEFHTA